MVACVLLHVDDSFGLAMAHSKVGMSVADREDAVLRKVLQVTVRAGSEEGGNGYPVYLEQLAAELMSEGRPTLLSRDVLERVLMDRLSTLYAGNSISHLSLLLLYLLRCNTASVCYSSCFGSPNCLKRFFDDFNDLNW